MVVKPNAKVLGPKFGKDVQLIIQEAKAGHFEKLANGHLKVMGHDLSPHEIEIAYEGKPGFNVETCEGMVVAIDTALSPELADEGLARDLIREIQELRKQAGYNVSDRITLALIGAQGSLLKNFGKLISEETLSLKIAPDLDLPDQIGTLGNVTIKIKR